MPYMYSEDGLCVHKKNPDGSMGKSMGCSKTRAEAEKHMAALMAAMHDEGKDALVGITDEGVAVLDATGEDELIYFGSTIKDLGDGRVGGYLVRFTSAQEPDLTGDFFDAKSDIQVPANIPLLFNHGLDPTLKRKVIGQVTTKVDDVGVWVEGIVHQRNEYEKAIYHMAMQGKLGWSSGALSHLVDREPAGKAMHIKTWFIGEASLTPTPAEYRNTAVTLKSLQTSEQAALTDEDANKTVTEPTKEFHMAEKDEVKTLTEADVKAQIAAALAEREAAQKAEAEKQAALKAAEEDGYKKAIEDIRTRRPIKYHSTEKVSDDNDGVGAFKAWMRTGQENDGLIRPDSSWGKGIPGDAETKAAWNVTTEASGGALIPDPLFNQIVAKISLASWVRQLPVQHFQTTADHLLVPRETTSQVAWTKTAEGAAYTEDEGEVGQKDLILYKYTKLNKVNEEFLMYNTTNWESWFTSALARSAAVTENTIFTNGDGSGDPQGVVTGATVANTTATTDIILPAEFMTFLGYLGAGYNNRIDCGLLMSNVTKYYLLGYTGNPFLYQQMPAAGTSLAFDNIQGYKVVVDDDLDPYTTALAKCIVFGNFNFYGVVERPGMLVQRNPWLYMANGQIGIFASMFRGGGVLQAEAFYYLTNKAT